MSKILLYVWQTLYAATAASDLGLHCLQRPICPNTVYVLVLMKMFSFTDQGFEDTENSNFISPQYRPHGHSPIITPHLALETQHASLKRKKHEKGEIQDGSPPLDRSPGGQVDMSQHRPLSMVVGSQTDGGMSISTSTGSLSRQVFPCKIS